MQPLRQSLLLYGMDVSDAEAFYERFSRILQEGGLTDTEAAATMGVSAAQISRIKKGIAASIRFEDGLKLCEKLGIDPWYLAFGRLPTQGGDHSPVNARKLEQQLNETQSDIQDLEAKIAALTRLVDERIPPQQ